MNLTGPQMLFLAFSGFTVTAAMLVVLSKNLFHAALWLAACFAGVASVYVVLQADFVGLSQIIVYVGAVSILMLFAIMLTEDLVGAKTHRLRSAWVLALPVAAAVSALVIRWFAMRPWPSPSAPTDTGTAQVIGRAFMQKYIFAFELSSVVLLAALVGAIYLAKQEKPQ